MNDADRHLADLLRRALPEPRIDAGVVDRIVSRARREHRKARWRRVGWRFAVPAAAAGLAFALLRFAAPNAIADEEGVPALVELSLPAPTAHRVLLIGDFNAWRGERSPGRRDAGGTWRVSVRLPAGVHRYAFLVDDRRYVTNANAPVAHDDEAGIVNTVVVGTQGVLIGGTR